MYKHKRLLTELYASSDKIDVVQGSNFFMITADWNTFNLRYVFINFLVAHRNLKYQLVLLLSNSHFYSPTRTLKQQLAL